MDTRIEECEEIDAPQCNYDHPCHCNDSGLEGEWEWCDTQWRCSICNVAQDNKTNAKAK